MSIWRAFERVVDAYVDKYFAEPIELHPMSSQEDITGSPQPDPNRAVLKCFGVYVTPGARATGEFGTIAAGLARNEAGVVTGAEWVSLTEDQLGNPANWGPAVSPNDRVYLPERATWHTINVIAPASTGRFNIYLTRVQEPAQ